jgi:Rrf2 family protein
MKISTKGRYGLRALVDLAMSASQEPVPLRQIADRQHISEGYLEQVFSQLRKAGIVQSLKGPQGGYLLAGSPEMLTVGRVLTLLEGDLSVVEVHKEDAESSVEVCLRSLVWEKIDESVRDVVEGITLQDLVAAHARRDEVAGDLYSI